MTEPIRPAATKVHGNENWIFIPAIASATLAPTVFEATGASTLDITNMVFADGAPAPTQATNRVQQNKRLGDLTVPEFIGDTNYSGGDLTYQFNPQGAALSTGVKLWEKIPAGTTGFLARRIGVPKATAVIAGQFIDVYPCEFGPSMPTKNGSDEAAEGAATCSWAISGLPAFKIAVLA